jgi:hypothetical protein
MFRNVPKIYILLNFYWFFFAIFFFLFILDYSIYLIFTILILNLFDFKNKHNFRISIFF